MRWSSMAFSVTGAVFVVVEIMFGVFDLGKDLKDGNEFDFPLGDAELGTYIQCSLTQGRSACCAD